VVDVGVGVVRLATVDGFVSGGVERDVGKVDEISLE